MRAKIFGFAGWSGSGKTTLIEKLIPRFVANLNDDAAVARYILERLGLAAVGNSYYPGLRSIT